MAFYHLIWTESDDENEGNEDHVGQHGVTFQEFVEVVENPEVEEIPHRFPNRAAYYGWTSAGKYLVAILDVMDDGITAYPVTAFEVEPE